MFAAKEFAEDKVKGKKTSRAKKDNYAFVYFVGVRTLQ